MQSPSIAAPMVEQAVATVACPAFEKAGVKIRCYKVRLPSISRNDSVHFDVPVVVFSQQAKKRSAEALIYIAGGPGGGGQAYTASLEFWAYWYQEAGIDQDLVIFNPRSLPGSSQAWLCNSLNRDGLLQFSENLNYREDIQRGLAALEACYEALQQELQNKQIARVDFLKSVSAGGQAQDMNFIASVLGYEHWHLWGASFGSRVAIIGAAHPQVKTVVLDSVYPLKVGDIGDWADNLNNSISLWQKHYAQLAPQSQDSFPNLLNRVLALLETTPIRLSATLLTDINTGLDFSETRHSSALPHTETVNFVLNADRLKSVMFSALYREDTAEIMINALQEIDAAKGAASEYAQLILAVEYFLGSLFDPSFNYVFYWSTECVDLRDQGQQNLQEVLAKTYSTPFPNWREWVHIEAQANVCKHPFFNYSSPDYQYTQKPTLIFSGELDPVTPPHWGELAKANIADSNHRVIENATHGILQSYYCDWQFWEAFLETGDTQVAINCMSDN